MRKVFDCGRMKTMLTLCTGIVISALLVGGAGAQAIEEYLKAYPSSHMIYLDGQEIKLEAYVINGSNYVRLRDVGEAMGFNVYWDGTTGTVQIDSDAPYTGQPPTDTTELDAVRQEIVQLVNQVRRENGLGYLTIDQRLMDTAQERADTLTTYHDTQKECEAAISHGYPYGFGVNITAFTSKVDVAQQAVTNWVNSPGHLRTMLLPNADAIGVGIAEDRYKTVCYLYVGDPKSHNPYE